MKAFEFNLRLERETGIEPATLCLGIVFKRNQAVPQCPCMVKSQTRIQIADRPRCSTPPLVSQRCQSANLPHCCSDLLCIFWKFVGVDSHRILRKSIRRMVNRCPLHQAGKVRLREFMNAYFASRSKRISE